MNNNKAAGILTNMVLCETLSILESQAIQMAITALLKTDTSGTNPAEVEWMGVGEYLKDKANPVDEHCYLLFNDGEVLIARLTFEHEFNLLLEFSHNGELTTIGHDHIKGVIPITLPLPPSPKETIDNE